MRHYRIFAYVLAIAAIAAVTGCGGGASGPEAVARGFVDAMKAGDTQKAAEFWDYITSARQQNENWDQIPQAQRKLIIQKLQENQAKTLQRWTRYFSTETKVAEVKVSGNRASAVLDGGQGGALQLVKIDGDWYVSGVGS